MSRSANTTRTRCARPSQSGPCVPSGRRLVWHSRPLKVDPRSTGPMPSAVDLSSLTSARRSPYANANSPALRSMRIDIEGGLGCSSVRSCCGSPNFRTVDHRNSPGHERGGGLVASLRVCQVAASSPSSSPTATGAEQAGHSPPMPTRRMKVEQVSQRCWPTARSPQLSHSYTVIGRRGLAFGTVTGARPASRRRR